MLYWILLLFMSNSIYSHLAFLDPLSVWMPAITILFLLSSIIISVTFFWLLYIFLAGVWFHFLSIRMAIPLPLCWYYSFFTALILFSFPIPMFSLGIIIFEFVLTPVSTIIATSCYSSSFCISFSLYRLFLLLGKPFALRHIKDV